MTIRICFSLGGMTIRQTVLQTSATQNFGIGTNTSETQPGDKKLLDVLKICLTCAN